MLRKLIVVLCICFIFINSALADEEFITRAEFIAMINNALELEGSTGINFSDVNEADWYYLDIAIGVNNDYIVGFSDNTIKPNKFITKEEAGSLLSRFIEYKELDNKFKIQDKLQIAPWCVEAIIRVVNNQIISLENDCLFPKSIVTKKQAKEYTYNLKRHVEQNLSLCDSGEYNFETASYNTIEICSNDISLKNCNVKTLIINESVKNFSLSKSNVDNMVICFENKALEICDLTVGSLLKVNISKDKIVIYSDKGNSFKVCAWEKNYLLNLDGRFSNIHIASSKGRLRLDSSSHIKKLEVKKDAKENIFTCELNSKIDKLVVDEKSIFKGLGNIIFAKGEALRECVFQRLPKNLRSTKKVVTKSIKKYKVDFYNINGELVKSDLVKEGLNANPPTLDNFDNYIFHSWDSSFDNVRENMSVYPIYNELESIKEMKVSEIGTEGKLKNTNNSYKIDDNSIFGFKTLVIKKDRLPNYLNEYKKFDLIINDLTLKFEENIFDNSYLMANFSQFIDKESIEDSLLKAYWE